MKKYIKKHKIELLSFFITLFILLLVFSFLGCFNDRYIVNSDMENQYLGIFTYFKNVINGNASFPYTFVKGMGGTMVSTLFYYFSSPFNVLLLFFNNIPTLFLLLILLKLSFSSLTMSVYLKSKFGNKNSIVIFSLCYALSTYNINYWLNIMWLDGVILAPLILLGIDKYLNKKKRKLYIISLFLAIVSNYYIGYMLSFFSLLYFTYNYFLFKNKNIKILINFYITTILIGFMCSFILIPCGIQLLNSIRINNYFEIINIVVFDYVAPLNIGFGNLFNPTNKYGFLVYCGTMIIPLIICYFTNKKISKKEKKLTIIMYLILLLPVLFPPLSYIWHMFTSTTFFNYRYSFIVVLFSLIIAYKSFINLQIDKKKLLLFIILFVILDLLTISIVLYRKKYYIYLDIYKIIITIILVIIDTILIMKDKKKTLLIICLLELITNIFIIGIESELPLRKETDDKISLVNNFKDYCKDNYRCNIEKDGLFNNPLLGNYNGTEVFLTDFNKDALQFLNYIADEIESNTNIYKSFYLTESLLGIKIIRTDKKIPGYNVIDTIDDKYILENPYALSLGYTIKKNINISLLKKNPLQNQEIVIQALLNKNDNYVLEVPINIIDNNKIEIKNVNKNQLYLIKTNIDLIINDKEFKNYWKNNNSYISYVSEENNITITSKKDIHYTKVYSFNFDLIKEFKNNTDELEIIKNTGNYIKGKIDVKEDSTLMLTIPYEKGWSIYIDNKKVDYYEVLNAFIGVDINKGSHIVELKYETPGLKIGIIISLISLSTLLIINRKK